MSPEGDAPIPLVDLTRQHEELRREIEREVCATLAGGRYILGPREQRFEREFAEYVGVEHAVGVASGTDALYLVLKAMGIGPGDEVVTTPFTFIATAEAIANCGAAPVFVDIDPATFNMDVSLVPGALTPRTRALLPVHLFGQPADMRPLMELAEERDIPVLEDCAQATGATYDGRRVGSLGTAGAFSFFPTKNLSCAGDGGMVTTSDAGLAAEVRMLRAHGSRTRYVHEALGVNSRLDELQAALLAVKLPHLDRWNAERARIAGLYGSRLAGVTVPARAPGRTHVYNQYTIRTPGRDAVAGELSRHGIGHAVYYETPLHLQPCFSGLGIGEGTLPACEKASREVLSLPMFHGMTDDEAGRVCAVVNEASARG